MALVKCKECGREISTAAGSCPGCGRKVKKNVGLGCVVLVLAGLGVFIFLALTGHQQQQTEKSQRAAAQASALTQAAVAAEQRMTAARTHCDTVPKRKKGKDPQCLLLECPGCLDVHYELAVKGKVTLGMNSCLVRRAWGKPEDINRTTTGSGVQEQWVYGRQYIYLEDDVVTSMQD